MTVDLVPVERSDVSLESDPSEYMAVVLHRAKSWLAEAQSIDSVRETKAMAVGYESVIREKELAFDAQLSATEIVRRCERRIGELVRKGQREGTIAKRGDIGGSRSDVGRTQHLRSPADFFEDPTDGRRDAYLMAEAPADEFDAAIGAAREEGNLSRANVVRKVKGEKPKQDRSDWQRGRRRIDSNRILTALAEELEAMTDGLGLMESTDLDPELVEELVPLIRQSITKIHGHLRRINHV